MANKNSTKTISVQKRSFTSKAPGHNPLDVLRKESMARNLCDEDGSRLPGVHWVLALAMAPPPPPSSSDRQKVSTRGCFLNYFFGRMVSFHLFSMAGAIHHREG
jgi:hypothetical protein